MKAFSVWGYEVSCCQSCGVQFPGPLCHFCEPPQLSLNGGTIGAQLSGPRVAQTTGDRGQPRSPGVDMKQDATPVNDLAKQARA